jgi:hypothetical protein
MIKVIKPPHHKNAVLPPLKFQGTSDYQSHYKPYSIREEIEPQCPVVRLNVPVRNYSGKRHIYYDE